MGNQASSLPYEEVEKSRELLLKLFNISFSVLKRASEIYGIDYSSKLKGVTFKEGGKSATEDKTIVYLCLRKSKDSFYDMNTLTYVCLHEIAHIIDTDYNPNHGGDFGTIFNNLLSVAESSGYYNPGIPKPKVYCGVNM